VDEVLVFQAHPSRKGASALIHNPRGVSVVFQTMRVTSWKLPGMLALLAGLTMMDLPGAGGAAAREMIHCQVKHSFCTERCLMRGLHPEQENMCPKRTCDR
jgi:hypothetical protein